jgi:hypothetical protein
MISNLTKENASALQQNQKLHQELVSVLFVHYIVSIIFHASVVFQ